MFCCPLLPRIKVVPCLVPRPVRSINSRKRRVESTCACIEVAHAGQNYQLVVLVLAGSMYINMPVACAPCLQTRNLEAIHCMVFAVPFGCGCLGLVQLAPCGHGEAHRAPPGGLAVLCRTTVLCSTSCLGPGGSPCS